MPQWSWTNGKSTFKLYIIWLDNHLAQHLLSWNQQKNDGKSTQSTDWKREAIIWKEWESVILVEIFDWSDLAPEDLEGAVVAPVVVPGVGDQPVRGSLLSYYYHVMITSFIIIFHFWKQKLCRLCFAEWLEGFAIVINQVLVMMIIIIINNQHHCHLDSPAQDPDGVTTKGLASDMLQQSQLFPEHQANISSIGPGKRLICSWGSPQRRWRPPRQVHWWSAPSGSGSRLAWWSSSSVRSSCPSRREPWTRRSHRFGDTWECDLPPCKGPVFRSRGAHTARSRKVDSPASSRTDRRWPNPCGSRSSKLRRGIRRCNRIRRSSSRRAGSRWTRARASSP